MFMLFTSKYETDGETIKLAHLVCGYRSVISILVVPRRTHYIFGPGIKKGAISYWARGGGGDEDDLRI